MPQGAAREDIGDWRRNGVALVAGLIPPAEARMLRAEAWRLWAELPEKCVHNVRLGLRSSEQEGWVLDRIDPVADVSPAFSALNGDPRLVGLAAAMLGEQATVLKEKIIFKPPGAGGYGPHRDGAYFKYSGVPEGRVLTLCLALEPATERNGSLRLYPDLRDQPLAAPPDEPRDIAERELRGLPAWQPRLQTGDAVLFDGRVPHCSDANLSGRSRCSYFVTYVPACFPDARRRFYELHFGELARIRAPGQPGAFFVLEADGRRRPIAPG